MKSEAVFKSINLSSKKTQESVKTYFLNNTTL